MSTFKTLTQLIKLLTINQTNNNKTNNNSQQKNKHFVFVLDNGRERAVAPNLHHGREAEGQRHGQHRGRRRLREREPLRKRRTRLPRHPQHSRHEGEPQEGQGYLVSPPPFFVTPKT